MDTLTLDRPTTAGAFAQSPRFLIRNDIPIPPRSYGSGRPPSYPFSEMNVGDSFDVSTTAYGGRGKTPPTVSRIQSAVGNLARGYAKRHNRRAKFATRKVSDTTIRIWRVA
jgi:hypothetical protein